jgi:thioredoxin-like negative regulator of GroEL
LEVLNKTFLKQLIFKIVKTYCIPDLHKAVKNSPDKYWKSKAQWHLALAHLKTGEVEKAAVLLKRVAGNDKSGEYRQKATELLSILHRKEKQNSGK